MEFIISEHAAQRMKERDLPNPNGLILKHAGKNRKSRIREACEKRGYNSNRYIYFCNQERIYICTQINIGLYFLITAFELELKTKVIPLC